MAQSWIWMGEISKSKTTQVSDSLFVVGGTKRYRKSNKQNNYFLPIRIHLHRMNVNVKMKDFLKPDSQIDSYR